MTAKFNFRDFVTFSEPLNEVLTLIDALESEVEEAVRTSFYYLEGDPYHFEGDFGERCRVLAREVNDVIDHSRMLAKESGNIAMAEMVESVADYLDESIRCATSRAGQECCFDDLLEEGFLRNFGRTDLIPEDHQKGFSSKFLRWAGEAQCDQMVVCAAVKTNENRAFDSLIDHGFVIRKALRLRILLQDEGLTGVELAIVARTYASEETIDHPPPGLRVVRLPYSVRAGTPVIVYPISTGVGTDCFLHGVRHVGGDLFSAALPTLMQRDHGILVGHLNGRDYATAIAHRHSPSLLAAL
jgi:hypothetical protein